MIIIYTAIYKCRLCGQTYERTASEDYVDNIVINQQLDNAAIPEVLDIHACDDGSFGVSDLNGYQYA